MDEINSPKRIEIRRHHNQLKVTSNGVLILGIWSVFRVFMFSLSGNSSESQLFDSPVANIIASIFVYGIVLAIDLRFRLVIWRGARREAYGRNTNNRYLVFTVILLILSLMSLCTFVYSLGNLKTDIYNSLASVLVEITSFVIMCELLHSGLKLRKIRSELQDANMEIS